MIPKELCFICLLTQLRWAFWSVIQDPDQYEIFVLNFVSPLKSKMLPIFFNAVNTVKGDIIINKFVFQFDLFIRKVDNNQTLYWSYQIIICHWQELYTCLLYYNESCMMLNCVKIDRFWLTLVWNMSALMSVTKCILNSFFNVNIATMSIKICTSWDLIKLNREGRPCSPFFKIYSNVLLYVMYYVTFSVRVFFEKQLLIEKTYYW